jgi:hypothetical protein
MSLLQEVLEGRNIAVARNEKGRKIFFAKNFPAPIY